MKYFFLMSLSLFTLSSFAQDKLSPGPLLLKLGGESSTENLLHYSSAPGRHSQLETENEDSRAVLETLLKEKKKDGKVTIACTGDSKTLNGVVKIKKIHYCIRTKDGKTIFKDPAISDIDGLLIKSKIKRVIDQKENESVVFGKQETKLPDLEGLRALTGIIDSSVSKCADSSKKEVLEMGRLNRAFNQTYIAKSNNQDFVVIAPSGQVTLYYCAPKKITYVNGRQKQESIPVDHYSFNLGNLKDRANCDFSDILSGTVSLRFQGSYYQSNITVRPVLGTDAEKKEYSKLCIDPSDANSPKVPDSAKSTAQ